MLSIERWKYSKDMEFVQDTNIFHKKPYNWLIYDKNSPKRP